MAPTSDDGEIGILRRREIEARILAPVYRILVRELGKERAREILTEAIIADARAQGSRFAQQAAETGEGPSLRTFIDIQDLWTRDDALRTETLHESPDRYDYDVTRCRYAEMYRELGLEEIGDILSCTRDFEFIHGYLPDVTLEREQTIMLGAPRCTFRYRRGSLS